MTPLPPRLSPVAALLAETVSDAPAAVTMAARAMDQVQIDCRADRVAGIALPLPAPGRAVSVEGLRLLNLAPGRWMALSAEPGALMAMLKERCAGSGAALVDQSHGRTTLRLSGQRARDVLAGGTGVDLHPRALAEDRVVSTALFHVPVMIDRRLGSATFDLHLARGYAHSLAERLIAAGRQYGVAVEA